MLKTTRSRVALVAVVVASGFAVTGVALAAANDTNASCTSAPKVTQTSGGSTITVVCNIPNPPGATVTVTATPTPSPSVTPAPTETLTPTSSSSPTPRVTPTGTPTRPTGPAECVKPTAGRTGATGPLTTRSGDITLTAGQSLTNAHVTGGITVAGDDVTIRNVQSDGGVFVRAADHVTVDHVTAPSVTDSSSSYFTSTNNKIIGAGGEDPTQVTSDRTGEAHISNVLISGNYFHIEGAVPGGNHVDGIQVRGANHLVITCNTFEFPTYQPTYNANVYIEDANGGNDDVAITSNWFTGSAWGVMLMKMTPVSDKKGLVMKGNTFANPHWGVCYQPGGKFAFTQSGNTLDGHPAALCS